MSEVIINANELEVVINSLDTITGTLMSTMEQFAAIRDTPFYEEGKAKEEVERILNSSIRTGTNNMDLVQVEADLFGKIQMLMSYYTLLKEYSYNALLTFKETDEKLAKLWEKIAEEMAVNG
ncbi:hypothetical protein IBB74_06725 [Listeria welshimeri]|uniref:hypothetical protein n=1 Tax=Listeria welshimeri TaxID=1643 RepID=UPI00162724BD|nr:hypothetical protein [Listeria welshimeri]MBC1412444.1 hypothetical protein [Listeria welshimeri]MBC1468178.1 hypothetical protein [Listeria welshimeri]MBC1717244.1 hypothetical protein [Listeria welshimeri]MBC1859784.1 hypothetical protein [Listeria welshimeri]MBC2008720.1 hypothetical protein [Listeria welshimeri]